MASELPELLDFWRIARTTAPTAPGIPVDIAVCGRILVAVCGLTHGSTVVLTRGAIQPCRRSMFVPIPWSLALSFDAGCMQCLPFFETTELPQLP